MYGFLTKALPLIAVAGLAAAPASGAVLSVTDFSGFAGSDLPNPPSGSSLEINGANDATDQGWFIGGAFSSGTNTDLVGGNLRFGPAASVYRNSSSDFSASVGQITTDNAATTGEISFDFEVAGVDLDGGEELGFAVQVLGWNSGTSTVGNTIGLQFNGQGSNWQVVGSAETPLISSAGTFSTGTIDLGSGFEAIGVRFIAFDNQTGNFGDTIDLVSVTVVPEPASMALIALGVTALAGRRRR